MGRYHNLQRFLTAYYIFNIACLGVYILLRGNINWQSAPKRYLKDGAHLFYWEKRTGWMLLALSAGRYFRRSTIDAYLAEAFGYGKVAAVTLLAAADYRLGILMTLWILISSLLFTQPRYRGAQKVDLLTPASFDSQALTESSTQATWLVMFTASWSAQCRQAQATFAELSLEYASSVLKFGELDVGRWPKVAKKFGMSIDIAPHQLPAFLLFKNGTLVKRTPEVDQNWERGGRLRNLLVDHFELDMILASSLKQL